MQLIGRLLHGRVSAGLYEVQNYQCTLELKDRSGRLATVQKCERVRYLQDHIAAFQDQAWGDGSFLVEYKCSPGVPVDEYRLGHNTIKLISLRGPRSRGDIDEFNIQWSMKNGFRRSTGFWGTSINHRTHRVDVRIIFPKNRPPLEASVYERNSQRSRQLGSDDLRTLPDGRHMLVWEKTNPLLYEDYIVRWKW